METATFSSSKHQTYAWFTMSREVEVKGIKMTATVPEDLQISLGTIGTAADTPETSESGKSLVNSNGVLVEKTSGSGASNGLVMEPTHTWDWSNSADISSYYAFGRLIPASSTTGEKIFYTPDANGVGQTVALNGSYYLANNALFTRATADTSSAAVTADATGTNVARATLHAFTAENDGAADTWTDAAATGDYTQAANWTTTNDDGYYVDIPIWIRTSSNANVNLSVDGYVLPGTNWTGNKTETELELYRAVRVALIDGTADTIDNTEAGAPAVDTTNIIPLKDAWKKKDGHTASTTYAPTDISAVADPWLKTLTSIVDSVNISKRSALPSELTGAVADYAAGATGQKFGGVSAAANSPSDPDADGNATTYAGTYGNFTCLTPTSDAASTPTVVPSTVATIAGSGTSANYGTAKKLIIRVWLDGEDGECWNDNAGQDWAISLKFSKIES